MHHKSCDVHSVTVQLYSVWIYPGVRMLEEQAKLSVSIGFGELMHHDARRKAGAHPAGFAFFTFSLRLFHFMTSKIVHHDRNGHFACDFFDYGAML